MFADQAPITRVLWLRLSFDRDRLCQSGQLAERRRLARGMSDDALLDGDALGIDVPLLGGRSDETGSRLRARIAKLLPRIGHGARAAGALHRTKREVRVLLVIGRCRFDADLRPVRIELVGQNRCDPRIGALPELDVLADYGDGVVGRDPQKGIRCELTGRGRSHAFWHRKIEADDQTGGYRALEKLPPIGGERSLHSSALQTSRGIMNGGADAVIGAATADVTVHREIDVAIGRLRYLRKEPNGRHDLS